MKKYIVTGMSCAACSARVEKAVSAVPGVKSCAVNLLTGEMSVEGEAATSTVIAAVEKAGYGASLHRKGVEGADGRNERSLDEKQGQSEEKSILKSLLSSLILVIALMYFSMGHTMLGLPVPSFFEGNYLALGLLQMLLSAIVMIINKKFFINGFKGLIHRTPNMDTLVALGSFVSFAYSVVVLFNMTALSSELQGGFLEAMGMDGTTGLAGQLGELYHGMYFESAAMILALITVGKLLEAKSKGKTTSALEGLMKLAPKTAVVERDGKELTIGIDKMQTGDIFVVRPGESVPADGVVVSGKSSVDESSLSGESIPVDKTEGSKVYTSTINKQGFLRCRALQVGEETVLSRIIEMVSDASATKAPIARLADRVAGVFVPVVMAIAVVTILVWLLAGESIGYALARGISVLVISCPCALGLATPVAIMVGSGVGAKNGILFKTAVALEMSGRIDTVVLDKTGTVTRGEPQVTDVLAANGHTKNELLKEAYALERMSEHPLAGAIVRFIEESTLSVSALDKGLNPCMSDGGDTIAEGSEEFIDRSFMVEDFEALTGSGLIGKLDGQTLFCGNAALIRGQLGEWADKAYAEEFAQADRLSKEGKTVIFFGRERSLTGMIAVADIPKKDSREAITELTRQGIRVCMLTGDNKATAQAIALRVGVAEVFAEVLPADKASIVERLKQESGGRVAMVGDGINDAPALMVADLGIAIGAGTDIAIDAADVVVMNDRLTDVVSTLTLGRRTLKNIKENLFWAFFYNCICIPLAAGAYAKLFGWELSPMIGAAAMSLSSVCVVTNALRLNLIRLGYKGRMEDALPEDGADRKRGLEPSLKDGAEREENKMEKTMRIEGMMCGHCEARVKKTLEAIEGVTEALVSHERGTAIVKLSSDITDEVLRKAVEDQDYKVLNIE